jgi:hypothetical protein
MTRGGQQRRRARRDQRGIADPRVLLALLASTVVTAAVAVPMGYQAYEARQGETRPTPTSQRERGPVLSVLPSTTLRDDPGGLALPPETTERQDTTTTGPTTSATGQNDPATTAPRSASVPTTTSRRPVTTAPPATNPPPTVASTVPPTLPTTTQPGFPSDGIVFAVSADARTLTPLEDAVVAGRIWVYVVPDGVASVRFWLDDPAGDPGHVYNVELQPPFSLVRGRDNGHPGSFDTRLLANGPHTVRTEVTLEGGAVSIRMARFTVANPG